MPVTVSQYFEDVLEQGRFSFQILPQKLDPILFVSLIAAMLMCKQTWQNNVAKVISAKPVN